MFEALKADVERYRPYGKWYAQAGFWVGAHYRFGHWAHASAPAPLRRALTILHGLSALPLRLISTAQLSREAEIGGGLLLLHPHSILVPGGTTIGKACSIYHEVTMGLGPVSGCPKLGDGVVVFCGTRILGGVNVGSNAELGANTVITRDIPAGAAVGASPSRVMPDAILSAARRGSAGQGG